MDSVKQFLDRKILYIDKGINIKDISGGFIMTQTVNKLTSRNDKLFSTMTLESIKARKNTSEKDLNNAILTFQKADKNNDGILSDNEIKKYDEDCKTTFLTTLAVCTGAAFTIGIAGFAIFKNREMSKQIKNLTTQLKQTTEQLNSTQSCLSDAQNKIKVISQKKSIKNPLFEFLSEITEGLSKTNSALSEAVKLKQNLKSIKS